MGIRDLVLNLFASNDTVTHRDILDQFKATYPRYQEMDDTFLANKISETFPKEYGFLKEFDPDNKVEPKYFRDMALSEVKEFQKKYPRYEKDDPVKLASQMEEVFPDKYAGLSKRITTPDLHKEGTKQIDQPLGQPIIDAVGQVLSARNPMTISFLEDPEVKNQIVRKGGDIGAALTGGTADMIAAYPAFTRKLYGNEGYLPGKVQKVSDYLKTVSAQMAPEDPTFSDKLVSGAASMVPLWAASYATGAWASQIPAMGALGINLARSIGAATPVVMESAVEYGSLWNDLRSKGVDPDEASTMALRGFLANIPLIASTNIFGGKPGRSLIRKVIENAPKEAIQEIGQSIIHDVSEKSYIDWPKAIRTLVKNDKKQKELIETGIIAGIIGAGFSGAEHYVERGQAVELPITSKLTPQNVDRDLAQRTMAIPGLAEVALNKDYPINNLRLVDALDTAVVEAEADIKEGLDPKTVALNAVNTFVSEIEAEQEVQTIEAAESAVPEAEQEIPVPPNEKESLLKLSEEAEMDTHKALRRIPRKARAEIRRLASAIRAGEIETIRAASDPIWDEAKAYRLLPNEDIKEEYGQLDRSFKPSGQKKGIRLDQFAANMVDLGILQPGQGSNEAIARLMKYSERERIPKIADVWEQATDIWLAQNTKRKSARRKVEGVLAANKIEDKVAIELVDEIIVDEEAYQSGYGVQYQKGKTEIKGETRTNRTNGIIRLASGATDFTGYHEAWHAVENLVATDTERNVIARRYASEAKRLKKDVREVSADKFAEFMLGKSTGSRLIDRVFGKIAKFLENLGNWFRGNGFNNAEDIFKKYGKKKSAQYSAELFPTERTSLEGRLKPHVEAGKKVGMNDRQALEYAKGKLAEASKPQEKRLTGDKPKQAEFGAGGVQGFGQGRQGEKELDLQYSAEPRKRAPIFFSQLEQVIQSKMANKAAPGDVLSMVRNAGVKQEEIEWSGIKEWLAEKGGPVTKAEVLDFIRQNNLQIKEVILGQEARSLTQEELARLMELEKRNAKKPLGAIDDDEPGSWHELLTLENIRDKSTSNDLLNQQKYYEMLARNAQSKGDNQLAEKYWERANHYTARNEELQLSQPGEGGLKDTSKFSSYQLPGGANYRELLLTLPSTKRMNTAAEQEERIRLGLKGKLTPEERLRYNELSSMEIAPKTDFKSSHFDEPNILAHIRFNERTNMDGKRILFVEEIQSDWHQQGRKKGYEKSVPTPDQVKDFFGIDEKDWNALNEDSRNAYTEEMSEHPRYRGQAVPDAPFKKTWHELALKRMLRYAAENGYDKLAWTTGEQQATRYDLSKQIDSLKVLEGNYDEVKGVAGYEVTAMKNGREVINKRVSREDLPDLIGKDMAQKAVEKIEENKKRPVPLYAARFAGLDLKVGGEGMKGFYDQIVPSFLNKYTKKWGGRVGESEISFEITPSGNKGSRTRLETVHSLAITPEMKDSVIYLGQPQYSAEDKKTLTLPVEYRNAEMTKPSVKETIGEYRAKKSQSINEFKDKLLTVFSTRLENINPVLKRRLRQFEFDYRQAISKDMTIARPFVEGIAKIAKTDPGHFAALDLAMKNGDMPVVAQIMEHHGIDPRPVTSMLNAIHARIRSVGYEVGYLPGYFPRKIKDRAGFLAYMQKQGQLWGEIDEAIRQKEMETGRYLNEDEKVNLINSFIRGFVRSPITLARTGNMRSREIAEITPALNRFYYPAHESLVRYIAEVNEAIETRKLFGRAEVKPGASRQEELDLVPLSDEQKRQSALSFNNIQDSIGAYVNRLLENHLITPEQQAELTDLFRNRFGYIATSGAFGLYKNVVYMDTIANPISALSQLDDLGVSLYRSAWNTPGSFVRALADKSKITLDDLDLDALSEEVLEMTKSQTLLRSFLRASGFVFMDRVGKETYMNTAIDKYRSDLRQGSPEAEEKIVAIFGNKADQVIDDLKSGKTTENVLFLAFNELTEVQPITLSEVPELYLKSPGGRIFYSLKTFMVKRLDYIRSEVNSGKTTPEKLKKFLKLYAIMIAFGAGVDELKDFVLNRKTSWSDRLIDNMVKPFGLSKFFLYRIREEGPAKALFDFLTPPHRFVDSIWKDIRLAGDPVKVGRRKEPRALEITASIPIGGKLWYWWAGRGAQKMRAKKAQESNPKYLLNKQRREIRDARLGR